jgi:hypothetical protein
MPINIEATAEGVYLYIRALGKQQDLEETKKYALDILTLVQEYGMSCVLLDEIDLEQNLGVVDQFEIAEFLDENLPLETRLGRLAMVLPETEAEVGVFWETACRNRGFDFKFFHSLQEARRWLVAETDEVECESADQKSRE